MTRRLLEITALALLATLLIAGFAAGETPERLPDLRLHPITPGSAENGWRPALYAKPEQGMDGQSLWLTGILISGFSDQDGLKIVARNGNSQYSSITITDVEVTRGWVTQAGRDAKLHVDAAQIDNRGGKPIPLTLRSVMLTKASPGLPDGATSIHDTLIVQGAFGVITLDRVQADSSLKFGEVNGSSRIEQIRVSNSPGLKLICFRGVKAVLVSSSPGLIVQGADGGSPIVMCTDDELAPLRSRAERAESRVKALERWLESVPK